jgi:hypothetical protein
VESTGCCLGELYERQGKTAEAQAFAAKCYAISEIPV